MSKLSHKSFLKDDRGAVAVTYALALIPLIAIAGLGYDYTRLVGMDSELQNAADQAALAGASQLDRNAGSIQRAVNAIQGGLVANSTLFSTDGQSPNVDVPTARIFFFDSKADAEAGTNPILSSETSRFAEAGFVQVVVETRAANYTFTPVVGALSGDLAAAAVAGLGSALCRIPPLMVCNPDEPVADASATINPNRVGQGLLAKPGGGGSWAPGNYGYLDIGPNGATGVRQALGWNGPPGQCVNVTGSDVLEPVEVDTQTGNIASGPKALNTRFDIYDPQGCQGAGTCSAATNVRKDVVRPPTGGTCELKNNGWTEPATEYLPRNANVAYAGTPTSMGHPRDRCHAVQDGDPGNCRSGGVFNFGDGVWDRDAYFRTHYIRTSVGDAGAATEPVGSRWDTADWQAALTPALFDSNSDGTPDRTIGNITRYEVYLWEEANAGNANNGVIVMDDTAASGKTTRNEPVCEALQGFTGGAPSSDRRRMSVAVVNCKAEAGELLGSSGTPEIREFIDVFLVQPSKARGQGGKHTKQDEIYVEIIGETELLGTGPTGGPAIRRDVPYLVK